MSELVCSECGCSMLQGVITINTTFRFLTYGACVQHLFWKDQPDSKQRKLLSSGGRRQAFKCPQCGTLTIPRLDPPSFDQRP